MTGFIFQELSAPEYEWNLAFEFSTFYVDTLLVGRRRPGIIDLLGRHCFDYIKHSSLLRRISNKMCI